jgi:glyoxylase I family protein
MYKGIEHTAIATHDPEALGGWYEKILDFPIVHRYSGNVFVRAADGTMLELIPAAGEAPETDMKTPGIRHLAVSVDNFDAGVADLESKGVEIFQHVQAGSNRLAFFRDPDGNILHLIHREESF